MMGDRYGEIVAVSKRSRSFLDPRDPRNGQTFTVLMDKSGKSRRLTGAYIHRIFDADKS